MSAAPVGPIVRVGKSCQSQGGGKQTAERWAWTVMHGLGLIEENEHREHATRINAIFIPFAGEAALALTGDGQNDPRTDHLAATTG
jgi:hypothetical protein